MDEKRSLPLSKVLPCDPMARVSEALPSTDTPYDAEKLPLSQTRKSRLPSRTSERTPSVRPPHQSNVLGGEREGLGKGKGNLSGERPRPLRPQRFLTLSNPCSAYCFGNGDSFGEGGSGDGGKAALRDATTRHPRLDDGRLAAHRGQNACLSPLPVPKTQKPWEGGEVGRGRRKPFFRKVPPHLPQYP